MAYDFDVLLQDSTKYNKLSRLKQHPDYPRLVESTKFLVNPTITQRWWHAANNVWSVPTCKMCPKPVKWRTAHKSYNTYCCAKCAQSDEDLKKKKEATFVARYGAVTYLRSEQGIADTNRYLNENQVTNVSQIDAVKQKVAVTMAKRYGGHSLQSPTLREKMDATKLKRYGTTNTSSLPEIKQQIKDTCQRRFGGHFNQQHIAEGDFERLNDRDWLHKAHHVDEKSLSAIARELGVRDTTTIRNRLDFFGIELKRFQHSIGEQQVAEFVQGLGLEVRTNDRMIISPRELDIFVPSHNLAIEYCGLYWHSDKMKHPLYHREKYEACRDAGVSLFTIFEDEWIGRRSQVERKIAHTLGLSSDSVVNARCCTIDVIRHDLARAFMEANHIQGPAKVGGLHIALMYDGQPVAVLTASQHVGGLLHIQRYATSARVRGGFTKLLAALKRHVSDWKQIVTFADNRWSDGALYAKTGFDLDKELPADYSYSPNGCTRVHKFNYRRIYLPKLLKHFDPALSEAQNCDKNGVLRIWDCGKRRYVINRK